jgi:hypothetical protein
MFELFLVVVVAAAVVIGIVVAIVRFIAGLFSIGSTLSGSSGFRSSSFGSSPSAPAGTSEDAQLAELRRQQSELRVNAARQMLIDAGINPDR